MNCWCFNLFVEWVSSIEEVGSCHSTRHVRSLSVGWLPTQLRMTGIALSLHFPHYSAPSRSVMAHRTDGCVADWQTDCHWINAVIRLHESLRITVFSSLEWQSSMNDGQSFITQNIIRSNKYNHDIIIILVNYMTIMHELQAFKAICGVRVLYWGGRWHVRSLSVGWLSTQLRMAFLAFSSQFPHYSATSRSVMAHRADGCVADWLPRNAVIRPHESLRITVFSAIEWQSSMNDVQSFITHNIIRSNKYTHDIIIILVKYMTIMHESHAFKAICGLRVLYWGGRWNVRSLNFGWLSTQLRMALLAFSLQFPHYSAPSRSVMAHRSDGCVADWLPSNAVIRPHESLWITVFSSLEWQSLVSDRVPSCARLSQSGGGSFQSGGAPPPCALTELTKLFNTRQTIMNITLYFPIIEERPPPFALREPTSFFNRRQEIMNITLYFSMIEEIVFRMCHYYIRDWDSFQSGGGPPTLP